MREGHQSDAGASPVVYCVIPTALAPKLHDVLRDHFREDPSVEIVVERRAGQRRGGSERRVEASAERAPAEERRRIRGSGGRRVAQRRGTAFAVDAPELPRRARRHAGELVFLERIEPSSDQLEDEDTWRLVTRIQAGSRDEFATLYLRYFDRVYGYLRVALNDPHEAEDACQQVFVKVLQGLDRYDPRRGAFRAWLFAIVRNHTITHMSRKGRFEVTEPAEVERDLDRAGGAADLQSLDWITDRELLMFIERLPLPQRQVLLLRFSLDFSHDQTAAILGRSAGEVRKIQQRALEFLRERLAAVGRRPTSRGDHVGVRRQISQVRVLRARRFALR